MNYVKFLAIVAVSMLLTTCSAGIISAKEVKTIDTLKLEDKYRLHLKDVDVNGVKCRLQLIENNVVVADIIVADDEHFKLYNDENLIVEGDCEAVFAGTELNGVELTDIKQYGESGKIIFTQDKVLLMIK